MPLGAAALLASAFLHALWNALLKREPSPEIAVAGVLSWAAAVACGYALVSGGLDFPKRAALAWAAGAGIFEGVYFVTLGAALARAEYGVVYTIARGGAMVIVWPAGAFVLREGVTVSGAVGACLVGAGIVLVAGRVPRRDDRRRAGLAFAAACAASIAGYHLCYDRALAARARVAPLFAIALLVALPFVFASIRGRAAGAPGASIRSRARTGVRWGVAGFLSTGSFLLFLGGLAATGAAVALTLRNTSILFAQGIAVALGERPTRRQILGAVVVAVGAALVARA